MRGEIERKEKSSSLEIIPSWPFAFGIFDGVLSMQCRCQPGPVRDFARGSSIAAVVFEGHLYDFRLLRQNVDRECSSIASGPAAVVSTEVPTCHVLTQAS